jgi:hypothetical protein
MCGVLITEEIVNALIENGRPIVLWSRANYNPFTGEVSPGYESRNTRAKQPRPGKRDQGVNLDEPLEAVVVNDFKKTSDKGKAKMESKVKDIDPLISTEIPTPQEDIPDFAIERNDDDKADEPEPEKQADEKIKEVSEFSWTTDEEEYIVVLPGVLKYQVAHTTARKRELLREGACFIDLDKNDDEFVKRAIDAVGGKGYYMVKKNFGEPDETFEGYNVYYQVTKPLFNYVKSRLIPSAKQARGHSSGPSLERKQRRNWST